MHSEVLRGAREEYIIVAAFRKGFPAMNNDTLMFAAIFLVAIILICAGVVVVTLRRLGSTSKTRLQKRRTGYPHRAFKDTM
jgi:hypothetical protein